MLSVFFFLARQKYKLQLILVRGENQQQARTLGVVEFPTKITKVLSIFDLGRLY